MGGGIQSVGGAAGAVGAGMGERVRAVGRAGAWQLSGAADDGGEEVQRQRAGGERERAAGGGRDAEQRAAGGDGADAAAGTAASGTINGQIN